MHPVKYSSRNILSKNLKVSVYALFDTLLTNVIGFLKTEIFEDILREVIDMFPWSVKVTSVRNRSR